MRNARGIFCAPKPLPRLLQAKNQSGAGRKRRCDFRREITFCPSPVRGKRLPFLPALRKNLLHNRQRLKRPASFCPVTHASGEQKHYAQQRFPPQASAPACGKCVSPDSPFCLVAQASDAQRAAKTAAESGAMGRQKRKTCRQTPSHPVFCPVLRIL